VTKYCSVVLMIVQYILLSAIVTKYCSVVLMTVQYILHSAIIVTKYCSIVLKVPSLVLFGCKVQYLSTKVLCHCKFEGTT